MRSYFITSESKPSSLDPKLELNPSILGNLRMFKLSSGLTLPWGKVQAVKFRVGFVLLSH